MEMPYHPDITTTVETITPEGAKGYLQTSTGNRAITRSKVLQYRAAMREGRWILNGEPIIFDIDDHIRNGHHRLIACIEEGVEFTTLVVRNAPREAMDTYDTGKSRSVANALQLAGYANAVQLAAGVRQYHNIKNNTPGNKSGMDTQIIKEWLKNHQDFVTSLKVGESVKDFLTPSVGAALHFAFKEKFFASADHFFKALASGESLSADDPIHVLRQWLIKAQNKGRNHEEKMAKTIRAWNSHREGSKVTSLGGLTRDGHFPTIL